MYHTRHLCRDPLADLSDATERSDEGFGRSSDIVVVRRLSWPHGRRQMVNTLLIDA